MNDSKISDPQVTSGFIQILFKDIDVDSMKVKAINKIGNPDLNTRPVIVELLNA